MPGMDGPSGWWIRFVSASLLLAGCTDQPTQIPLPEACMGGSCQEAEPDPTPTAEGACPVSATYAPPTAVLLLDQSGSMTAPFGTQAAVTRWDAMYASLFDPVAGVLAGHADSVRLGMSLYTGLDGADPCPLLTEAVPQLGDVTSLDQLFAANQPQGDTPTGESIEAVANALAASGIAGPKAIVLATDGVPDTCAQPNPNEGEPESVAGARNAFEAGVRTYVISIGDEVSTVHLQALANAGQGEGPFGTVDYYQSLEPEILTQRFDDILSAMGSCSFSLDRAVVESLAASGTVHLDGIEVPFDDTNGWRIVTSTEIELVGSACEQVTGPGHQLDASFPCAAVQ